MENDHIRRVKNIWIRSSLAALELPNEEDIAEFESRNGVKFPQDMKEYFLTLNGTADEYDLNFFRLNSLKETQKVAECLSNWIGPPDYRKIVKTLPYHDDYYVIGDFQCHLLTYAVHLHRIIGRNDVIVISGENFQIIADSFSDFLNLYLAQDNELFSL